MDWVLENLQIIILIAFAVAAVVTRLRKARGQPGAEPPAPADPDEAERTRRIQEEIRRAAAVALEQEMKARVQEMNAKVVEAQAQVPLAMADAFRNGRLGVMDYYRMQNIQADTDMRTTIAAPDAGKK